MPLSLVHYHFGGKRALLVAVLERENAELLERQRALFAGPGPLAEKWRTACDLLDEDIRSGYVRVLWELWAAGLADADLAALVAHRDGRLARPADDGVRGVGPAAQRGPTALTASHRDVRGQTSSTGSRSSCWPVCSRRRRRTARCSTRFGDLTRCAPRRSGAAAPVGLRLRAVAAHRHRAPRPRAVAGVVVEGDVAGVPRARLQAVPGALGLGAGDDAEQAAGDAVDARRPGGDARVALGVERDRQARAVGGGVQRGGRRRGRARRRCWRAAARAESSRMATATARSSWPKASLGRARARTSHAVSASGRAELLLAGLLVDRVDEVLDQGELIGAGFVITTKIA